MIFSNNEKFNDYLLKYEHRIKNSSYDFSLIDEYPVGDIKIPIICHEKDIYGKEHGVFYINKYNLISGKGCPICGRENNIKSRTKDISYFLEKAIKRHGDKYDYHEAEYNGTNTPLKIICPIHGEFWQTPNNHYKFGCPECGLESMAEQRRITFEEFKERAEKIHGNKYSYDKTSFQLNKNLHDKILIHCNVCGRDFYQSPSKHLSGEGCKYCNSSKLENLINDLLKQNNIIFLAQFTDKENSLLKQKRGLLKFDFYLPNLNLAIECQGTQHFKPVNFWEGEVGYYKQLERDERKYLYCLSKGISLYYIIDEKEVGQLDNLPYFYNNIIYKSNLDLFIKKLNSISFKMVNKFKILKNKLYELIHLPDYSGRLRSVL